MGRHTAADGAASHPLVVEALTRRAAAHGDRGELPGTEGPIGWPVPGPDEAGEPTGWPGGLPGSPGSDAPVPDEAPPVDRAPTVADRRRRLFGRPTAA